MPEANETNLTLSPEANLTQMNLKVRQLASDWIKNQAESEQERKKQRYDSMSDSQSKTREKKDYRRIADCLEGLIDKEHIENWFHVDRKSRSEFPRISLVIFLSDGTIMPLRVASNNEKGRRTRREIEASYGQPAGQVLPVFQYIDNSGYPVSQERMAERMLAILETGPRIKA